MGEIADALRRARSAREGKQREAGGEKSTHDVTEALVRARAERARTHDPGGSGFPSDPAPVARPEPDLPPSQSMSLAPQTVEAIQPESKSILRVEPGAPLEICRRLALRVRSELRRHRARTLAIVSAVEGEGKTTVASDLSLALATLSSARTVALLDLDLRRPSIARVLGLQPQAGIEEVLAGGATLEDTRISIERPQLDVFPATPGRHGIHELLVLPSLSQTLIELQERYELIVIDTPPSLLVPDAAIILGHVSACIPVARAGRTRARHLRNLMKLLEHYVVLGEILNEARLPNYEYGAYDYTSQTHPVEAAAGEVQK